MLSEADVDRIARRVAQIKQQEQPPPYKQRDNTARELTQQLGPEYIAFRQGAGSKVPYLEGHQVIALANEIFGFDGWSSEIRDRQTEHIDPKTGKLACSVRMRVTLPNGSFREDIGYGTVMKGSNIVQDLEKAGKEACTDALKRVLRQFGESLGNCLYSKHYMQQVQRAPKTNLDFDFDALRRPKRRRTEQEMEKEKEKQTEVLTVAPPAAPLVVRSPRLDAQKKMLPPKPQAESTPRDQLGPPPNLELSSSPPYDLPPPGVPQGAPQGAPQAKIAPQVAPTPGLVSAAAIEKYNETNDYGDASFDTSISLGPGCVLDQSRSEAVRK